MSELSPATKAVLAATFRVYDEEEYLYVVPAEKHAGMVAAAALRAAAEIVAPLSYEDVWTDGRILQYEKDNPVRNKLLAIADELEAQ